MKGITVLLFQMVDCRETVIGSTRLKRSFDVAFLTGIDVDVKADVGGEEDDFDDLNLNKVENGREGKDMLSSISEEGVARPWRIKWFL